MSRELQPGKSSRDIVRERQVSHDTLAEPPRNVSGCATHPECSHREHSPEASECAASPALVISGHSPDVPRVPSAQPSDYPRECFQVSHVSRLFQKAASYRPTCASNRSIGSTGKGCRTPFSSLKSPKGTMPLGTHSPVQPPDHPMLVQPIHLSD